MSDLIYITNARVSFPNLVSPQKRVNPDGKEKISYNCELLLTPDHPGYIAFMKKFGEMALEKGKEHASAVMQMINADRKSRCYGNGAEKVNKKTFVPYEGYEGKVYLSCGRETPPQMIQDNGLPVDPANTMLYQAIARKIYGGCRVNVAVKPWWQNPNPAKQYGHGIRCDLIAIQFAGDDTPFGEGVADVTGMFGAVSTAPAAPAAPAAPPAAMGLPPFMLGQ